MPLDLTHREITAVLALLDAYLHTVWQEKQLAGLSAALVYDQSVLWTKGVGYANRAERIPATPQTIYHVASITKLFTATMLLQLRDAGKLHLDDPIECTVPELHLSSRFSDPHPLTFRQVASHTAGLPKDFPLPYFDTHDYPPIERMLQSLQGTELIFPPWSVTHYSNVGYALLGYALERIAGQPYRSYVTEQILHPLGMLSSGFAVRERAHLATGYYAPAQGEALPLPAPHFEEGGLDPAGALYASVEDLARFISLQFRDLPAGGNQILSGTTLREMQAPVFMEPGWERGKALGWWLGRLGGWTYLRHAGNVDGFDSDLMLIPDLKLGLVICSNTNIDVRPIIRPAMELLIPVIHRAQRRMEEAGRIPAPAEWQRYTGHYLAQQPFNTLEITLADGRLMGHFQGEEPFALEAVDRQVFRMQGGYLAGELMRFEMDEAGRVTQAHLSGFTVRRR